MASAAQAAHARTHRGALPALVLRPLLSRAAARQHGLPARNRASTGPGGDYASAPGTERRSGRVRGALRARQELPVLELFLSVDVRASRPCAGSSARWCRARKASCCVSGVRGAGVIEPRLAKSNIRIDRAGGDYRSFDINARPARQSLRGRLRSRAALPRLDLPAAGLRHGRRALLSEGHDQAAAPQAVLHFRRGAIIPRRNPRLPY